MKTLSSRMKISTVEQKKKHHDKGRNPTLTTKENKIKRTQLSTRKRLNRKTSLPRLKNTPININRNPKQLHHQNLQRIKQQFQNHQTAFLRPSQLNTHHNLLRMSYHFFWRSSKRTLHEAFKDFATQDFPIDRFYLVVKVNSQSSSEAILRATSSDSDAFYFPTPIPATAPVYNPTPLNLKDNKLQLLKDAQRKRIILMLVGGSLRNHWPPKGIKPYSVGNLYTHF